MEVTEEQRAAQIEAAMQEEGVKTEESVFTDYFGFSETWIVPLPDGKSSIMHQSLTEGDRRKYLNAQTKDVTLKKGTGDAQMKLTSGDDKVNLLKTAIKGWTLQTGGQQVIFNPGNLERFLAVADPRIIDLIHKDVVKKNSWLMDDMTVEQIDTEIASLTELREKVAKLEEGKAN